jgi:hypothetical protein
MAFGTREAKYRQYFQILIALDHVTVVVSYISVQVD